MLPATLGAFLPTVEHRLQNLLQPFGIEQAFFEEATPLDGRIVLMPPKDDDTSDGESD